MILLFFLKFLHIKYSEEYTTMKLTVLMQVNSKKPITLQGTKYKYFNLLDFLNVIITLVACNRNQISICILISNWHDSGKAGKKIKKHNRL